ncbi:phage baseplate assembly protein V [Bartonella sp. HY038]|uniref:phage baseplate assembly protein V n=1 Tax=Bartonella sp. HY038 TaxID=2759660 RepID=UPI0015FB31EC|nr:phage baseplate assembly protein V [Bartonella sp. HY038]
MASGIAARIQQMENRIAEMERRDRNRKRTGTISEVDTKKGLARVELTGGDKPFLTDWVPWKEIAAGTTSTHIPPVKGQQVDVLSESGDLTDGVIEFAIHSNKNPRPHDGPQAVIQHGESRITLDESTINIETASNITVKCASEITLDTDLVHITNNLKVDGSFNVAGNTTVSGEVHFKGPSVRHNDKNIGDTHKHLGVQKGGSTTDVPE